MNRLSILLLATLVGILSGCDAPPATQQANRPPATVAIRTVSMDAWHRGVTAAQAGRNDEALAAYDRAIEADENNFHALADKGLLLSLEGRYAESESYLSRALAIAPDSIAVHYNCAIHHKLQGHLDRAADEFRIVLAAQPKHPWSLYGLATIYADRGETDPALDYLEQAVKADPATADAARTQEHFAAMRELPRFQTIVGE